MYFKEIFNQILKENLMNIIEREISEYNLDYDENNKKELVIYNIEMNINNTKELEVINLDDNKKYIIKSVGEIINSKSTVGFPGVIKFTNKKVQIIVNRKNKTIKIGQ